MTTSPQNRSGFTLIETLVALFVLSIALSGAFSVLVFNLQTSRYIKNVFIANGLAQEGLEVARNIRDTDWHLDNPYGTLGDASHQAVIPDGVYRLQYNSSTLMPLSGNPVLKKSTTGVYSYDTSSGSTDTIFKRTVEIARVVQAPNPVAEIIVTVRVSWNERFGAREVSGEEHLFDWYAQREL